MAMHAINVEVVMKSNSQFFQNEVKRAVTDYLRQLILQPNMSISLFDKEEYPFFHENIENILIGEFDSDQMDRLNLEFRIFVYSLDKFGCSTESENDENGIEVNLSTQWILPSADLFGLWESLYYDENIKEKLLNYAVTIMNFADRGVDSNLISCNKVILLHGPPGTGKTSLCKALAQKLAIRLQNRYSRGILVEINSHSLFSKWFSESPKLVSKMFGKVKEILENKQLLVCLLIDEVESLAIARDQARTGNDPSDSIRVVNTLLTELDQIKRHPNVFIFTTSNISGAIDLAFVDRADIKQHIGLPSAVAIYKIYHSCITELIKTELLESNSFLIPASNLHALNDPLIQNPELENSKILLELCEKSKGLSGRSLRKIPLLTYALYLKKDKNCYQLQEFLTAMKQAIDYEKTERTTFQHN